MYSDFQLCIPISQSSYTKAAHGNRLTYSKKMAAKKGGGKEFRQKFCKG